MKTICAAGILLLASSVSAEANAFDDFNQGLAAANHGDDDLGIMLLGRALSEDDLAPELRPVALVDRARAFGHKHEFDEAIADYDAALKLRPQYFEALWGRAQAFARSGNTSGAANDCQTMAKVIPTDVGMYEFCGRLDWQAGKFNDAAKKFETALELEPDDGFSFLWLCLATLRTDSASKDRLPGFAQGLAPERWPSPLVDLYLGRGSLERAQRRMNEGNDDTRHRRECEAAFYGGEWQLLQNNAATGRTLLKQAADLCADDSIEIIPAKSEWKRLSDGAAQ